MSDSVIQKAVKAAAQEARIQALAQLAALLSANIVLPNTDGREIRLRRVATPTSEPQRLLDQREITIPVHLEWNAACRADFVTS